MKLEQWRQFKIGRLTITINRLVREKEDPEITRMLKKYKDAGWI